MALWVIKSFDKVSDIYNYDYKASLAATICHGNVSNLLCHGNVSKFFAQCSIKWASLTGQHRKKFWLHMHSSCGNVDLWNSLKRDTQLNLPEPAAQLIENQKLYRFKSQLVQIFLWICVFLFQWLFYMYKMYIQHILQILHHHQLPVLFQSKMPHPHNVHETKLLCESSKENKIIWKTSHGFAYNPKLSRGLSNPKCNSNNNF